MLFRCPVSKASTRGGVSFANPGWVPRVRRQWETLVKALADGRVNGFDILGTVLIDGQLEQATWIRGFIRAHS